MRPGLNTAGSGLGVGRQRQRGVAKGASVSPQPLATFGGRGVTGAVPGWEHCGKMAPHSITRSGCGEHVGLEDTSET